MDSEKRSPFQTIAKNTSWLTFAQIIVMLISAVGGILLARYLGAADFGKYGFAISFVTLFAIFSDFGVSQLLINEVSQDTSLAKKYFDRLITLKIILGIFAFVVILILIQLVEKSPETRTLVLIAALGVIVGSISSLITPIFRAFEKMKYEAYFKIFGSALIFLSIIAVIVFKLKILHVVQFQLLVGIIVGVTSLIFLQKKFFKVSLKFNVTFWIQTLKRSWPLGVSAIFISIYYHLDTVMLGLWKSDQVVGWYNIDYKILMLILAFVGLYYSAVFPTLSKLVKTSLESVKKLGHISLKFMIILSIPVCVTATMIPEKIINILYGDSFIEAAPALQILIWTAFFIAINGFYGNALIVAAHRKTYLKGVGIGAAINVILNIILIPPFSLEGAAIATVVTELYVLAYMYFHYNKLITPTPFLKLLPKPIISGIVMAVVLLFMQSFNIFITIIIGLLAYSIIILILKATTVKEILHIKQIIFAK